MFYRLGLYIHAHRHRTLAAALTALILSAATILHGGALGGTSIHGLESARAQALVDRVRGFPEDRTFVAIFRAPEGRAEPLEPDDEDFQRAMAAALAPLRADPRVAAVATADDAPPSVGLLMTNGLEHAALVYVTLAGDLVDAQRAYPEVRAKLRSERLEIVCTGQVPYMHDLDRVLERDLIRAELLSLPLAILVLVLVFRTWLAALLPVLVGAVSVVGAIAVVLVVSRFMEMAQYTINVCSLIGLGVSIDYSLFTVARYREELAAGHPEREALARALSSAGRVVVYSGIAVGSGLAGLISFHRSYLQALGIGGAIVVVLAVLSAVTVLPALLAVFGPRVLPRAAAPAEPSPGGAARPGRWQRLVVAVMRRPVRVLVPTLAVLVAMGLPFRHLRMAAADVRVLPGEVEARRGYELMRRAFPELAATRVAVAVRFPSAPALTGERAAALFDLAQRVKAIPGVTRVESVVEPVIQGTREAAAKELLDPQPLLATAVATVKTLLVREEVVLLYAITEAPLDSEQARNIVRTVRAERRVADGELLVAGRIAADLDTTDYIVGHAPRAIAIVVGATVLALFLLLGSVLLPLKALLMNALSISGSFGALVWIFQDGNLFVAEGGPIEPTLPVLLFCVLFGLSMDYEVLMLARIKEVYERTGDNVAAVAEGLERTAGLITSAAAIMVAVFAAFALGRVVFIQAVGFGMALAVALDATLVRVLLVPATMRLFGDLNWWQPKLLARLRAALGFGPGGH